VDYDKQGQWSAAGTANQQLVDHMLSDPYFALAAPKSTGRDYFQLAWLRAYLTNWPDVSDVNIQASLAELTVQSVANALKQAAPQTSRLLVCGGGVHNQDLLKRLQQQLPDLTVESTADYGVDPDYVEAMAFAWLAKRTMEHKTGSLCSVTGARHNRILGGIYQA
jgi:anhydro-N-acetylmuramic acid kinase